MNKTLYLTLGLALFFHPALAHEIIVHEQITLNAIASASTNPLSGINSFIETVLSDCNAAQAERLINNGSAFEDNVDNDEGGKRSLNHFYDPLSVEAQYVGLSEFPLSPMRIQAGRDSFTWASITNSRGYDYFEHVGKLKNVNTTNKWSWQNARGYEWLGLTSVNPTDRSANLGHMFRSVGQVMHLLQDTTQPQHVRNEQHLDYILGFETPWHSHIEDYGSANVLSLNYTNSVLDWRNLGFTKLEDFWDRHLYNGDPQVLDTDAQGGTQLGLAEFSNGNFLGERHSYADYFRGDSISYYSYPRRDSSTDYYLKRNYLSSGIGNYLLHNGYQGNGIYLRKTHDGITIDHHSRFTYAGVKRPHKSTPKSTTINDPNVLHDYHDILIPKAVEYSAGILDYFFRGTLDTILTGAANRVFSMNIINASTQDLKDGAFHLFYDDSNAMRTELTGTNFSTTYSDSLAASGTIQATFFAPTNAVNFLLLYQGTIGITSGTNSDPVDAGIAIAAKTYNLSGLNFTNLVWDDPPYQIYGTASGTWNTNTFTGAVSCGANDGAYAWNWGYMTYTGVQTVCNVHIDETTDTDIGFVGVEVYVDDVPFGFCEVNSSGSFDCPITIPASVGAEIAISVFIQVGTIDTPYTSASASATVTLTPAY